MRILALETTDKTGSVAAMAGGNLLAELTLEQTQRSARSLAPAMLALLKQVGWLPANVQLVAVSVPFDDRVQRGLEHVLRLQLLGTQQ